MEFSRDFWRNRNYVARIRFVRKRRKSAHGLRKNDVKCGIVVFRHDLPAWSPIQNGQFTAVLIFCILNRIAFASKIKIRISFSLRVVPCFVIAKTANATRLCLRTSSRRFWSRSRKFLIFRLNFWHFRRIIECSKNRIDFLRIKIC